MIVVMICPMSTEPDLHAHILQPQPSSPTQLPIPSEAFTPRLAPGILSHRFDRSSLKYHGLREKLIYTRFSLEI